MIKTQNEKKREWLMYDPAISHCIDCVVDEADFFMGRPNPCRISKTNSEINRYLRHKNCNAMTMIRSDASF